MAGWVPAVCLFLLSWSKMSASVDSTLSWRHLSLPWVSATLHPARMWAMVPLSPQSLHVEYPCFLDKLVSRVPECQGESAFGHLEFLYNRGQGELDRCKARGSSQPSTKVLADFPFQTFNSWYRALHTQREATSALATDHVGISSIYISQADQTSQASSATLQLGVLCWRCCFYPSGCHHPIFRGT